MQRRLSQPSAPFQHPASTPAPLASMFPGRFPHYLAPAAAGCAAGFRKPLYFIRRGDRGISLAPRHAELAGAGDPPSPGAAGTLLHSNPSHTPPSALQHRLWRSHGAAGGVRHCLWPLRRRRCPGPHAPGRRRRLRCVRACPSCLQLLLSPASMAWPALAGGSPTGPAEPWGESSPTRRRSLQRPITAPSPAARLSFPCRHAAGGLCAVARHPALLPGMHAACLPLSIAKQRA